MTLFGKWLKESGLTAIILARMARVSRNTIKTLLDGKVCRVKTVKKVVMSTKKMKNPLTYEMFEKEKK